MEPEAGTGPRKARRVYQALSGLSGKQISRKFAFFWGSVFVCNFCPVQGACFCYLFNLISSGHAYTGKNPEQCVQAEVLSEFERLRSSARHAALPVIPSR